MKKRMTKEDFMEAMINAAQILYFPKSTMEIPMVNPVSISSNARTVMSSRYDKTFDILGLSFISYNQVKQWKNKNPDNVDQVPVQAGVLKHNIFFGMYAFRMDHINAYGKQCHADNYVYPVQPGDHIIETKKNVPPG
jgi:hypothetical protein